MAEEILKLTTEQIGDLAESLPQWRVGDDRVTIKRSFKFRDFRQAFDFMTEIAAAAEARNHHPDWSNSYNRVVICLTTHDIGGLSTQDIQLAKSIDAVAYRFGSSAV